MKEIRLAIEMEKDIIRNQNMRGLSKVSSVTKKITREEGHSLSNWQQDQ